MKATQSSGDPLEWPGWSGVLDNVVHQKLKSNTEKMQNLQTILMGQVKTAISEI